MSDQRTEIVDIESLDVGAVILLGLTRAEWRLESSEEVEGAEWLQVRLVNDRSGGEIARSFHRTAKFETVCS